MKQSDLCVYGWLGESHSHFGCSTTLIGLGFFMLPRQASKEQFVFKKSEPCRDQMKKFEIKDWKIQN